MPTAEQWITGYLNSRDPGHRYASFDYCFNYFQGFTNKRQIAQPENIERSCLHLGFYLASWGMFRGSSKLLRESSVRRFVPAIRLIASSKCDALWEIDVDRYSDDNINLLISAYDEFKAALLIEKEAHLTLITKLMLGVFACTPALDSRFQDTFRTLYADCGFRSFNRKALGRIRMFYQRHAETIDRFSNQIRTLDFSTGNDTSVPSSRAKIVDMIGFQANGVNVE